MGQSKECLRFGIISCLGVALDACARASLGRPIVVTREERREQIERDLAQSGRLATLAINRQPDLGQTSSLRAGLACLAGGARAFLIYPVDYPLIRARDIERLCAVFLAESPPPVVVAPSFQRRRGHPVLVDVALVAPLLALPSGASAREVLAGRAGQTRYVELEDDRVLMDMDTPDDYRRCLARYVFG
jgi:CTP:molybdopterin cytidylyltransferase MocA